MKQNAHLGSPSAPRPVVQGFLLGNLIFVSLSGITCGPAGSEWGIAHNGGAVSDDGGGPTKDGSVPNPPPPPPGSDGGGGGLDATIVDSAGPPPPPPPPPVGDAAPPASTQIVVNFGDPKQPIDGFGASESWIPTITDAQADLFFSQTSGIGLSMLRLGIAPDGSSLFSGNWGTAQKAVARNPSLFVWGAPWSPPANDKTTNNTMTGSMNPTDYVSWASALAKFPATAKANGVVVSAISAQNEPDFNTNGKYEMCLYDGHQMTDFVKALGPALAALQPPVFLMTPEASGWGNLWGGLDYVDTVMADSTAAKYVGVLATHQYGVNDPPSHAIPGGKRLWETEMSDFGAFDPSINHAVGVAAWIRNALVDGGVSAWHYWWLVCQAGDNEGLIGNNGDGSLTKRVYGMGNYSRFVRPGWTRLGTTGMMNGLLVTAFANLQTSDFAIVAVNTTIYSMKASFGVVGPVISTVDTWVTSGTAIGNIGTDGNLSHGSAPDNVPMTITASTNAFSANIPHGIVTFIGKGH
jgi:glucuronoarabinoxylan endo-1,4-beta-xylanase